ncbi:yghX, partial [Cucurbita argyrosperma subsp. argyrosperma]
MSLSRVASPPLGAHNCHDLPGWTLTKQRRRLVTLLTFTRYFPFLPHPPSRLTSYKKKNPSFNFTLFLFFFRVTSQRLNDLLHCSQAKLLSFSMAASASSTFKKIQIQREGTISELGSGFKALIPDLYRGKVGLDTAEAQHLMDGLDWQGAVKDIHASVNWLKANGSKKVGVTGYCMGGALSIASAVLIPEVDAVVSFYGVPSPELADPAHAKAPVQAHFGELDSFVGFSDLTAAKKLEEKLKQSGVPHEVHIYKGSGHAFMNRSEEGVKRRKNMGMLDEDDNAVELAWSRFQSWMSQYLSA